MDARHHIVLKAGPPNWTSHLHPPSLDGLDPAAEARTVIASGRAAVASGPLRLSVVEDVFTLLQLAIDERCSEACPAPSQAVALFRSKVVPGALGLVNDLTVAQQTYGPAESVDSCVGKAVVATAKHLSGMERHVAGSNTSALLVAHNGLARLLKQHWSVMLGGTLDAPVLLSHLCHIYRDGLRQLDKALSDEVGKWNKAAGSGTRVGAVTEAKAGIQARDGCRSGDRVGVTGRGEPYSVDEAHLRKFGKLLATIGARISSLLRHLGPECGEDMFKDAVLLLAEGVSKIYPGEAAKRRFTINIEASDQQNKSRKSGNVLSKPPSSLHSCDINATSKTDAPSHPATPPGRVQSAASVVSDVVFGRVVEAFLSMVAPPPCARNISGGKEVEKVEELGAELKDSGAAAGDCHCYSTGKGFHNPWTALAALCPSREHEDIFRTGEALGCPGASTNNSKSETQNKVSTTTLGAVVLLCEALRVPERLSPQLLPCLKQCYSWIMVHLARLFPLWLSFVVNESRASQAIGAGGKERLTEDVVEVLLAQVSLVLGQHMGCRAVTEFEEVQLELLEGFLCQPHPLCRHVWAGALRDFLTCCDAEVQVKIVHTIGGLALDPDLPPTKLHYLIHALGICLPALAPSAICCLHDLCLDSPCLPLHPSGHCHYSMPGPVPTSTRVLDLTGPSVRVSAASFRVLEVILKAGDFANSDKSGFDVVKVIATATKALGFEVTTPLSCSVSEVKVAQIRGGGAGEGQGGGRVGVGQPQTHSERVQAQRNTEAEAERATAAAQFLLTWLQQGSAADSEGSRESRVMALKDLMLGGTGDGGMVRIGNRVQIPMFKVAGSLPSSQPFRLCMGALSRSSALYVLRLFAEVDKAALHDLCVWMETKASMGQLSGAGLIALAHGVSLGGVGGRRGQHGGGQVLPGGGEGHDGELLSRIFRCLFGALLWPVTTSAFIRLEALARHAGPKTAALLPQLVKGGSLPAFKGRLAKQLVTFGNGSVVEPSLLRQLEEEEHVVLENRMRLYNLEKMSKEGSHEVVLREGDDLATAIGRVSGTIVRIQRLKDGTGTGIGGGSVCLTLRSTPL